MARHVASQPVTVTERDTVPRASRHIRPPIRGGVHVTRDQTEAGQGPVHLLEGSCLLAIENRQISMLRKISALSTYQRVECHQPARRRATASVDTVQTRHRRHVGSMRFAGTSRAGPRDGKSWGRGFRARTAEAPFALIVGRCARARGCQVIDPPPVPRRSLPLVCFLNPKGRGGGGKGRTYPHNHLSSLFRGSSCENLGRPPAKNPGRP